MYKNRLLCILPILAFVLSACGGGGGGGGGSASLPFKNLSGLSTANAVIVTGNVAPSSKALGDACQNDDEDDGFFIFVDGVEVCQAYFESETIYSVDANGVRARVRYLDADGNEISSTDLKPANVYDAGQGDLVADFQINGGNDYVAVLADRSSGAIYSLPALSGVDPFEGQLTAFELKDFSLRQWAYRLLTRAVTGNADDQLLFAQSTKEINFPALLSASLNGGDLQAEQVSPVNSLVNSFLPQGNSNVTLYLEGGGTGSGWVALNTQSGAFRPIDPLSLTGGTKEEALISNDQHTYYLRNPDGALHLGTVYFETDSSECIARLYKLAFGAGLEMTTTQVAEARDPGATDGSCDKLLFSRSRFTMLGNRWVAPANAGLFLELNWSVANAPSLRYVRNDELKANEFTLAEDLNTSTRKAVVATANLIYLLGTKTGASQKTLYALNKGGTYAGNEVPLSGINITSISPYVGDSIVVNGNELSSGDAVVLQVFSNGDNTELSRNGSVDLVVIERIN